MIRIFLLLIILTFPASASSFEETVDVGLEAIRVGDYEYAIYILKPFAMNGNIVAERELGNIYAWSNEYKNYQEAMRWLSRSASQGDAESQRTIGMIYKEGIIVPKSESDAAWWLIQAASHGDPIAKALTGR